MKNFLQRSENYGLKYRVVYLDNGAFHGIFYPGRF